MEQDRWLGHCAWCDREIGEEGERIAIKARFRDKKDYRKHEGMVVSFAYDPPALRQRAQILAIELKRLLM